LSFGADRKPPDDAWLNVQAGATEIGPSCAGRHTQVVEQSSANLAGGERRAAVSA
jgi:hypothetical protein